MKKLIIISSIFIFSLQAKEVSLFKRVRGYCDAFVAKVVERKAEELAAGTIAAKFQGYPPTFSQYEEAVCKEISEFEQLPEEKQRSLHAYKQSTGIIEHYLRARNGLRYNCDEEIERYSCESDDIQLPGEMEFHAAPLWGSSIVPVIQEQALQKVSNRIYKNRDMNARLIIALDREEERFTEERNGLWTLYGFFNEERVQSLNRDIAFAQRFKKEIQEAEDYNR